MTDDTASESTLPEGDRWLTIDGACRLLGVDQSTLRRWSDSGKVPVFRTPGGHRRYSEASIRALLQGERRPRPRLTRSTITNMSLSAYEPDYLRQARDRSWHRSYQPEQLDELRVLGRRLIELAARTMSESSTVARREIAEEGRRIGRRYGTISALAGLSETDTVEAFLFFRFPVLQAMTRFIDDASMPAQRAARVFLEISQFTDEVLIATIAARSDEEADRARRS